MCGLCARKSSKRANKKQSNYVIICEEFSNSHEELGHFIPFIKNKNDYFNESPTTFIVMRNNTKFKGFLTQENVDKSLPIKSKYKLKP